MNGDLTETVSKTAASMRFTIVPPAPRAEGPWGILGPMVP